MTADPADLTSSDPPRIPAPGLPREVVPTLAARGVLRRRDDVIEKLAPPELQAEPEPEREASVERPPAPSPEPDAGSSPDESGISDFGSSPSMSSEAVASERPASEPEVDSAAPASTSLEAFRDQLGKVADDVIASRAGVSRGTVGAYRRKLGIPAYDGYLFQKGSAPPRRAEGRRKEPAPKAVVKGAKAKAQPRPGRKSQAEGYLHLLGVETDRTVADRAGVSLGTVRAWRRARGIPAASIEQAPTRAARPDPGCGGPSGPAGVRGAGELRPGSALVLRRRSQPGRRLPGRPGGVGRPGGRPVDDRARGAARARPRLNPLG
jgi:hypothetical protein